MIMSRRYSGFIIGFIFVFLFLISYSAAFAIQIGKTVEYKGGNMGKVIFDGTKHNDAGYHCMKCHNDYFIPIKGAAKMTYADHTTRKKYCFGCHDGSRAFDVLSNCNICHKK